MKQIFPLSHPPQLIKGKLCTCKQLLFNTSDMWSLWVTKLLISFSGWRKLNFLRGQVWVCVNWIYSQKIFFLSLSWYSRWKFKKFKWWVSKMKSKKWLPSNRTLVNGKWYGGTCQYGALHCATICTPINHKWLPFKLPKSNLLNLSFSLTHLTSLVSLAEGTLCIYNLVVFGCNFGRELCQLNFVLFFTNAIVFKVFCCK